MPTHGSATQTLTKLLHDCSNFSKNFGHNLITSRRQTDVNAKRGNEKAMENPRRDTDFFNRKNFRKEFIAEEEFIDGFQVITVKTEKSLNRHVIFLHGGGYVLRAVRSHKNIVERSCSGFRRCRPSEKRMPEISTARFFRQPLSQGRWNKRRERFFRQPLNPSVGCVPQGTHAVG